MREKSKLNIDQIAKMAYVSRSVVSRVLNNHPRVSAEARERVMKIIEAHNYRPSSVARSLATDRTFEICIIAPRRKNDAIANGFWPLLHLGISEQCIKRGYFVSLTMISTDTADEVNERIVRDRVFDGYILITQQVTDLVVPSVREQRVPVVLIGRDPKCPELSSIDVDNYAGAYEATAHLVRLGHRRVAAILGDETLQESTDRKAGYIRALEDAGLPVHPGDLVVGSYSEESGFDIMNAWLASDACPPAVFCASDAIATGVLLALYKAGVRVPEEVAVVGFDDVPNARYTCPPLTTIHQPIYEKGREAADIIIDRIEARTDEVVHRKLQAALVVRESCGADQGGLRRPAERAPG